MSWDEVGADISKHFAASAQALAAVAADAAFMQTVGAIALRAEATLRNGGKILLFGNGGSAADAQHIAAEFVGRYKREREGLAAIALTTDTSILTAVGNDYGYEKVFSRQVAALGRPGDLAIGLSTSGRSPNVVAALEAAARSGLSTALFTGAAGAAATGYDHVLAAPSTDTAVIQQIHMVAAHAICGAVENALEG